MHSKKAKVRDKRHRQQHNERGKGDGSNKKGIGYLISKMRTSFYLNVWHVKKIS